MDSIKEEKPSIDHDDEEFMDYDDFNPETYENITIEPLPELPRKKESTSSSKSKTKPSTSKTKLPAATVTSTAKTITKPLINLKNLNPIGNAPTATVTTKVESTEPSTSSAVAVVDYQNTSNQSTSNAANMEATGGASSSSGEAKPPQPKKPRTHSKLPKQCNVCGLIVKRLRDHMKNHPDQLEFKCDQCPRTYLTKAGLDRHIDVQHADDR